jgi:NAD(P)-dependent dehydrogenase (short-subunit alcohol dehydrogenase family)
MRLKGKVAIITGAAKGLGEGFARLFAKEGAKVVLTDIDDKNGLKVTDEIVGSGGDAIYIHLDVTQEADWDQAVKKTVETYGTVDVLVNNAGVQQTCPVDQVPTKLWEWIMGVNCTGTFFGTRAVVPIMKKAGKGSIVNISSNAGLSGGTNSVPYHTAKGGVRLMTKATAIECAPFGIRANSIHPGPVDTPMQAKTLADPVRSKRALDSIPLGRIGQVDEIGYAAVYLASDESSFTTGAELVIDGGQHQFALPGR